MRIQSSGSSALTTSTGTAGQTALPPRIAQPHPMAVLLFGRRPPRPVDRRKHPKLKKTLRKLDAVKDQIAELLGAPGDEFRIQLCEGGNACIGEDGTLSVGVGLLEKHGEDDDLLVAVLGHEIGHQPWSWPDPASLRGKGPRQLEALSREEEAKADRFAGRVLADLGADPESICRFLLEAARFESRPASGYYPAPERTAMIRTAFRNRRRALEQGRALRAAFGGGTRDLR